MSQTQQHIDTSAMTAEHYLTLRSSRSNSPNLWGSNALVGRDTMYRLIVKQIA